MTIYLPLKAYDLEQWRQMTLLMSRVVLETGPSLFQEAKVLQHHRAIFFFHRESQISSLLQPFRKFGLDAVGVIKPKRSKQTATFKCG